MTHGTCDQCILSGGSVPTQWLLRESESTAVGVEFGEMGFVGHSSSAQPRASSAGQSLSSVESFRKACSISGQSSEFRSV